MPRAALPRSGESGDAIIMLVAFGTSTLFVAVQIGFAIVFAPIMVALYNKAGVPVPSFLGLAETLGVLGIFFVLAIFDAVVFAICVWAARRWWIGLLFAPPAVYLATTFGLFIGLVGGASAAALAR